MKLRAKLPLLPLFLLAAQVQPGFSDELLLIEDDTEELILDIEGEDDLLILQDTEQENGEDELLILDTQDTESASDVLLIEESPQPTEKARTPESYEYLANSEKKGTKTLKMEEIWLEYGHFNQSASAADRQAHLHGKAEFSWNKNQHWEYKVSARVDGFTETGEQSWDKLKLDYDDIYIRYRTDNAITTIGAQKVLWGRIDEMPPTDRLSTQDLRRFMLDDLAYRRLSSAAIRYERFFGNHKIDMVAMPTFRKSELPGKDSVWYPINRETGEIMGIETTPGLRALVQSTPIKNEESNSEGGAGIRFSSINENLDYAITAQYGRQTNPGFRYNPSKHVIEAVYPRTWIIGTDFGIEALGGTIKFEGAWLSDVAVLKLDGGYDTAESINWGVAWEVFPGDGDGRLNLQITGINLQGTGDIFDKKEVYTFNGSYEVPFADNHWRFKTRFYAGLKDEDYYLNPELAFTGWDAQEIYLEAHWFDGDEGTPGGFHENNSLITAGWRVRY